MAETLGHILQDIKNNYHNKYPAAMRTVKSWKNYLIKDYHVTIKRGDVILGCRRYVRIAHSNKLMDEVHGALDDSIRTTVIYPNNGKKISEFIKENMEEIKRMKLI